jgi:hypothetical protein
MMISSFANEESYKELFFNLVVLALAYKFLCTGLGGAAPTVRFAPVVPWAKTGPGHEVSLYFLVFFK